MNHLKLIEIMILLTKQKEFNMDFIYANFDTNKAELDDMILYLKEMDIVVENTNCNTSSRLMFKIRNNFDLDQILMPFVNVNEFTEYSKGTDFLNKTKNISFTNNPKRIESPAINYYFQNDIDSSEYIDDIYKLIFCSIIDLKMILLKYKSVKHEETVRVVCPLQLFYHSDDWYMYCYCLKRKDFRNFKISGIKEIIETNTVFFKPNSKIKYVKPTIPSIEHLVLRFDPNCITSVFEKFKSSEIEFLKDNVIQVSTNLLVDEELIQLLLSFGKNIEIIKPKRIRNLIKLEATKIIEQNG